MPVWQHDSRTSLIDLKSVYKLEERGKQAKQRTKINLRKWDNRCTPWESRVLLVVPSVPLSKISVNRQRWHVQFCSFFKLLFLQFAIFLLSLLDQVFFVWENVTFPFCYCSLFTHPNLLCYLMTDKKKC